MVMQGSSQYYRRNRNTINCCWFVGVSSMLMFGLYVYWNSMDNLFMPSNTPIQIRQDIMQRKSFKELMKQSEVNKPVIQNVEYKPVQGKETQENIRTQHQLAESVKETSENHAAKRKENKDKDALQNKGFETPPEKNKFLMKNMSLDRPSAMFVHEFVEDVSNVTAQCVDYKMMYPLKGATKLCVHNHSDDNFVSGFFLQNMTWEHNHIYPIGAILNTHRDMIFFDIGSHMGMYTMYANKAGNLAIAVDPLKKNLRLLKKTVELLKQEERVKIFLNAVSNKHEKLYLEEGQAHNIGSTHLVAADKVVDKDRQAADYKIQTIMLDDLLEVFDLDNKKAMMKMDIEGSELLALQGGYEFFRRVNICYVLMEFFGHKFSHTGSGLKIVDFMASFNFIPYMDFAINRRLPLNDTKDYPPDVVFLQNSSECMKPLVYN